MNCANCGDPFDAYNGRQKFCSESCQYKDAYRRKQAAAGKSLRDVRMEPTEPETFFEREDERRARRQGGVR